LGETAACRISQPAGAQAARFLGPRRISRLGTKAVEQWVYKPTLLNGAPVEVVTIADVRFTLPANN
jgi:hypothetical protein